MWYIDYVGVGVCFGTFKLGFDSLIDENIQESEQKVPLLGDIPLLGNLFKSQVTRKEKSHLVVFIRPRILRDDEEISQLSSRKYNYIRASQMDMRQRGVSLMSDDDTPLLPKWNDELALPPTFDERFKKLQQQLEEEEQEDGN